ncbi:ATP-dependent DNA helicase RecG [Pedobacter sp. LMG 31464]|uniref:ATP-dependent DNA helicase RecG n=1 Tax=Pedobacter planticolens TaxID=2679964 RepID=A0A923DYK7_9SPHI|nr:ATP-dependent DNA helicase RecG [Pedobacter planticolens]MBB2146449.1 ATP-dependent DNA helicase RecG [Pedobacter planticolens]
MFASNLDTSLVYLKGVGPKRAELLQKELGISTYEQLLNHYPFRYIDRTRFYKINELNPDMPLVQVIGRITSKETIGEKHKKRVVAKFTDDTGTMDLVWFQSLKWVEDHVMRSSLYIAFGKPTLFNNGFSISHPDLETYPRQTGITGNLTLQPIYNTSEKMKKGFLDSKCIQKLIHHIIELHINEVRENLPAYILEKYKLISRKEALIHIHFPANTSTLQHAERRLKFEELFFIQLQLLYNKQLRSLKFKGALFNTVGEKVNTFYNTMLPFDLTNAQKRVIKEIRLDTQKGIQMNRLIQGDVGSGKTVVALMSMLLANDNGYQACMMAPTEILARQHYQSLVDLLKGELISVAILTGNSTKKQRTILHQQLEAGEIDILVGTHALIEDKVQFKNLGLVVIDEQHRFGVEQRAKLWRKNVVPPHILVMTATPIPRTLAMTLYGDLDVSVIDELPVGRKPIETKHLFEGQRMRMFGFMKQEIAKGRQVYIVYPLIRESEKLDLLHLEAGVEQMRYQFPLPDYQISIVHGQMPNADKQYEMQRFIDGKSQIMVATTVIEVGVNVPNASVMIIENAERFGLSQLHQLRGRVGRGAEQSFCILMTGNKLGPNSKLRLETMVKTNNGFEISEIDLQLRGPGDITGTQQSGVLELKMANLVKDQIILQEARNTVIELFEKDTMLELPENILLKNYINKRTRAIAFDKIS